MAAIAADLQQAGRWLAESERVAALTGAGISAESGVPTFRGEDGLWQGFRATDLATPQAFARDPKLVWNFYNWRRELLAPLQPNPAHKALIHLEEKIPQFSLITQNIDDLHHRAGSKNLVELHGNIWMVRCTQCHVVRPHVVWFGEQLDPTILDKAVAAIRSCDTMLVIGTSALVQPAASLAIVAKEQGARVVEINLEPTPYSHKLDIALRGKAGEILPQVVEGLG
jgi:NAD-dependent deacetylase